jgi:hypothetical protein
MAAMDRPGTRFVRDAPFHRRLPRVHRHTLRSGEPRGLLRILSRLVPRPDLSDQLPMRRGVATEVERKGKPTSLVTEIRHDRQEWVFVAGGCGRG